MLSYCSDCAGGDTGEAFADQVLAVATAAFREAQVAFAAIVSVQTALMPDLVARIRSLLLSTARLSEGELLRRTDDLGPTTAQTAPHRVWRWNLNQDHIEVTASPGEHLWYPKSCHFCTPPGPPLRVQVLDSAQPSLENVFLYAASDTDQPSTLLCFSCTLSRPSLTQTGCVCHACMLTK